MENRQSEKRSSLAELKMGNELVLHLENSMVCRKDSCKKGEKIMRYKKSNCNIVFGWAGEVKNVR